MGRREPKNKVINMSVRVIDRNLSEMQFFKTALKLRKDITFLLLRDFGVKANIRTLPQFKKQCKMSDEDEATLKEIMEKYGFGDRLTLEYPDWLIAHFRDAVIKDLQELMTEIVRANTIYPTKKTEEYERRSHQNAAIGWCEVLLQDFQYVISILPVDVEKYMRYVDLILDEEDLLKGWRKSDQIRFKEQIKK